MDNEKLQFDINEDDLLDDSEGLFKVDTQSSSYHEQLTSIVTQNVDVEKDEAPNLTKNFLSRIQEKNKQID